MTLIKTEIEDNQGNKGILTLDTLNEKVIELDNFVKENLNIEVSNGEKKIVPISSVLKEIWDATEIIRDFSKVWRILKKYKIAVYFIIAIILLVKLGWNENLLQTIYKLF